MERTTPLLAFAVICQQALIEQDGTLSLIRIVDTIAKRKGEGDRRVASTRLNFAIGLRSGGFRGKGKIRIVPIFPKSSKISGPEISTEVELGDDEKGANFLAEVLLPIEENGVYWFDVFFNEELLTRTPLTVVSSELPTSAPAGHPTQQSRPD